MSVRQADHGAIKKDLVDYLEADRGEFRFSREDDGTVKGEYLYRLENVSSKPGKISFDLSPAGAAKEIYVFGSSPLVSRLFHQSESVLFPEKLEAKLNSAPGAGFKVRNFGVVSYDSYEIKELVKALISEKKPDLIVFYEGHMDYEAAYMAAVKRRFYVLRRGLYTTFLNAVTGGKNGVLRKVFLVGDWILRSAVEPNIFNLLQKAGLVKVADAPFEVYNSLILEHYRRNIGETISAARENSIPLVIVTPIANMEAKPFGVYGLTEKYYNYALQEDDYGTRVAYLVKARDTEILTGDLRAKTGLYDFLRGLDEDGVHVMDLEAELLGEGFPFDYEYFYDIGHMKPELHEIVAEKLYRFLKDKGLVSQIRQD